MCVNNIHIKLSYRHSILIFNSYRSCNLKTFKTNILLCLELHFNFYKEIVHKHNLYHISYYSLYHIRCQHYIFNAFKLLDISSLLILYKIVDIIFCLHFIFFIQILSYSMTMIWISFISCTQKSILIYFLKHYDRE